MTGKHTVIKNGKYLTGRSYSSCHGASFSWTKDKSKIWKMNKQKASNLADESNGKLFKV